MKETTVMKMAKATSDLVQELTQEDTPPLGSVPKPAGPPTVAQEVAEVQQEQPQPQPQENGPSAMSWDDDESDDTPQWQQEKTILVDEDEEVATFSLVDADTGEAKEISDFPCTIGRHESATYCTLNESVSRKHAIVDRNADGTLVVTDCGSLNGIKVNDQKTEQVLLADGDEITLGKLRLRVCVEDGLNASTAVMPAAAAAVVAPAGPSLLERIKAALPKREPKAPKTTVAPPQASDSDDVLFDYDESSPVEGNLFRRLYVSVRDGHPLSTSQQAMLMSGGVAVTALLALALAHLFSDGKRARIVPAQTAGVISNPQPQKPTAKTQEPTAAAAQSSTPQDQPQQTPVGEVNSSPAPDTSATVEDTAIVVAMAGKKNPLSEDSSTTRADGSATTTGSTGDASTSTDEMVVVEQNAVLALSTKIASVDKTKVSGGSTDVASKDTDAAAPAVVAAKPKPKPKITRRSSQWSQNYIDSSMEIYVNGDAEAAIRRLEVLSRSRRNQKQYREQAGDLALQLRASYTLYRNGQAYITSGYKDEGFSDWASFLESERRLFGGARSVYANNVTREVVAEFTAEGDKAEQDARWHDAYRAWRKAAALNPDGTASASIASLEARAQDVYRQGYRLESVNVGDAMRHWEEVTTLIPPGTQYYTKARAKLSLYSR